MENEPKEEELKVIWNEHGGIWSGPALPLGMMEEAKLLTFLAFHASIIERGNKASADLQESKLHNEDLRRVRRELRSELERMQDAESAFRASAANASAASLNAAKRLVARFWEVHFASFATIPSPGKIETIDDACAALERMIDNVRKQILLPSPCQVSGHFRFQLNGGNCMMCHQEIRQSSAAKAEIKKLTIELAEANKLTESRERTISDYQTALREANARAARIENVLQSKTAQAQPHPMPDFEAIQKEWLARFIALETANSALAAREARYLGLLADWLKPCQCAPDGGQPGGDAHCFACQSLRRRTFEIANEARMDTCWTANLPDREGFWWHKQEAKAKAVVVEVYQVPGQTEEHGWYAKGYSQTAMRTGHIGGLWKPMKQEA